MGDSHRFYTLYLLDSWAVECERSSAKVTALLRQAMSALTRAFKMSEAEFRKRLYDLHEREVEALEEDVTHDSYDEERRLDLAARPDGMPEKDLVAMLKRLLRAKVLEAEKELAEWQGDKDGRKHAAFWASRLKEHQEVLRRVEEAFDGAFPRDE